jgi:hypothetical protein
MVPDRRQCTHCKQYLAPLVQSINGRTSHWLCVSCSGAAVLLDLAEVATFDAESRATFAAGLRELAAFAWGLVGPEQRRRLARQADVAALLIDIIPEEDAVLGSSSSSED